MTEYYLDIETVPLEQYMDGFDPLKQKVIEPTQNKIITIQFRQFGRIQDLSMEN